MIIVIYSFNITKAINSVMNRIIISVSIRMKIVNVL